MKYYTYVLIDPRTDKPFYIGKGQKKRMYEHVKDVQRDRIPNRSNKKLGNKIKKILLSGNKVKYKKVFITENEQDAYNREKKLIQEIGLENLCNISKGGKGSNGNKGRKFTEEHKRKIGQANKGRKLSDEHKSKISKYRIGKNHSKKTKRKMSESRKGKKHSYETKKKMSTFHKGKELSTEHKQKISESLKKFRNKNGEILCIPLN